MAEFIHQYSGVAAIILLVYIWLGLGKIEYLLTEIKKKLDKE